MSGMSLDGAAAALRDVSQFDKDEKRYQDAMPVQPTTRPLFSRDLRQSPKYLVGGLADVNLALLLRGLSTPALAGGSAQLGRRVVLAVSNASVFFTDPNLEGLAMLAAGLGLELRFVERHGTAVREGCVVSLQWERRYQGVDVEAACACAGAGDGVMKRALELFPDLEQMRQPKGRSYYRRSCQKGREVVWFTVQTVEEEYRRAGGCSAIDLKVESRIEGMG